VKGEFFCGEPNEIGVQRCLLYVSEQDRTARKPSTCDLDTATACGADFTDDIARCETAGLTGKLLVKCLEDSIKAKTFVEYASKLGLLNLLV